ncbi:hypothetical protein B0H15DRAFT_797059 [Mycena belliarum]|uniref:Uncharacterized protein n=1 Tax=Mycena belliarum TaxID=1033014 RepID=A0AAD6XXC6_9AGAR|nr:hypothetical protein B0H15DRAFT_797057 [Mycena belliae]KAJ7099399.1 hypothetical protein B0H15DRAFT_797059 [Mycena belliae]
MTKIDLVQARDEGGVFESRDGLQSLKICGAQGGPARPGGAERQEALRFFFGQNELVPRQASPPPANRSLGPSARLRYAEPIRTSEEAANSKIAKVAYSMFLRDGARLRLMDSLYASGGFGATADLSSSSAVLVVRGSRRKEALGDKGRFRVWRRIRYQRLFWSPETQPAPIPGSPPVYKYWRTSPLPSFNYHLPLAFPSTTGLEALPSDSATLAPPARMPSALSAPPSGFRRGQARDWTPIYGDVLRPSNLTHSVHRNSAVLARPERACFYIGLFGARRTPSALYARWLIRSSAALHALGVRASTSGSPAHVGCAPSPTLSAPNTLPLPPALPELRSSPAPNAHAHRHRPTDGAIRSLSGDFGGGLSKLRLCCDRPQVLELPPIPPQTSYALMAMKCTDSRLYPDLKRATPSNFMAPLALTSNEPCPWIDFRSQLRGAAGLTPNGKDFNYICIVSSDLKRPSDVAQRPLEVLWLCYAASLSASVLSINWTRGPYARRLWEIMGVQSVRTKQDLRLAARGLREVNPIRLRLGPYEILRSRTGETTIEATDQLQGVAFQDLQQAVSDTVRCFWSVDLSPSASSIGRSTQFQLVERVRTFKILLPVQPALKLGAPPRSPVSALCALYEQRNAPIRMQTRRGARASPKFSSS